jgi:hypothetical protein
LGTTLGLDEVLSLIIIKICDTIDCATLVIYLQSPETGLLEAKCAVGQNAQRNLQ